MDQPLWQPSPQARRRGQPDGASCATCASATARRRDDYAALYAWSIREPEQFWQAVWSFCGVIGDTGGERGARRRRPHARRALVSRGAAQLRREPAAPARRRDRARVPGRGPRARAASPTPSSTREVSRLAQALRAAGVVAGDRVAGYMPNMPGAVIAMLAATSIGAIWSSCSPDFGVQGVLDRFGQIEPKVLFAADGYFYSGKTIDVLPRLREIARAAADGRAASSSCPTRSASPRIDEHSARDRRARFHGAVRAARTSSSSGCRSTIRSTSCIPRARPACPKCIVHGAGGTLLQHLKEHVLHTDLKPGDRLFYFTTCGWMMWNWLVSALASRGDAAALRRLAVHRRRPRPVRLRRGRAHDGLRHVRQVHRRGRQARPRARATRTSSSSVQDDALDRLAARRRKASTTSTAT